MNMLSHFLETIELKLSCVYIVCSSLLSLIKILKTSSHLISNTNIFPSKKQWFWAIFRLRTRRWLTHSEILDFNVIIDSIEESVRDWREHIPILSLGPALHGSQIIITEIRAHFISESFFSLKTERLQLINVGKQSL